MIVRSPLDLVFRDLFFDLEGYVDGAHVYMKLEGFHVTGSIKIKTAVGLISNLEQSGEVTPGLTKIVESSSGNLGVALALVCSQRGYNFICVTDPNASHENLRAIAAYGAEVIVADKPDIHGGYLQSRIQLISKLLSSFPNYIWLNQYANRANVDTHASQTAPEILTQFPTVDWLFIGSGTTGTLMGCAEHFRRHSPSTRIVAVEPEGSVTFGGSPGVRHIPGIGMSQVPKIADRTKIDEVVYVSESATIEACRTLARRYGLLLGGSSGSVLAAVLSHAPHFDNRAVVVAISPDNGEKYLDSVYNDDWVRSRFQ